MINIGLQVRNNVAETFPTDPILGQVSILNSRSSPPKAD